LNGKRDISRVRPALLAGAFLLLWFAGSLAGGRYSWGFDHLRYYPLWLRLAWLGGGLAGLAALALFRFPAGRLAVPPARGWPWALALLAGLCFFLLRQAVPLLGDGFLRIREISGGRIFSLTEPLTTMLHGLAYRLTAGEPGSILGAARTYSAISLASGLVAFWLYHRLAARWFPKDYLPALALLAGLGCNLLFFGYVESYGPLMAAVAALAWLGTRALEDDAGGPGAVLCLGLVIALHAKGVFLLPALLYLLAARWSGIKKKLWWSLPLAAALPLAVVLAGKMLSPEIHWEASLGEIPRRPALPLWDGLWGYGLLSPGHWLDLANQYLLMAPAGLLLLLGFAPPRRAEADRAGIFLGLMAAAGLAFVAVTDPKLGTARDWDLFAWAGLPAALWAIHRVRRLPEPAPLLLAGGFLSLWLMLPWVHLNSDPGRSIERYVRLLEDDPRSAAYGYESLAIHYRQSGNRDRAEWAYGRAVQHAGSNPRMLYNYGTILVQNGRPAEAADYFARALRLSPEVFFYWNDYGSVMLRLGDHAAAQQALERAVSLNPDSPDAWYNLGIAYSAQGRWAAADSAFARAAANNFDDQWVHVYRGEALMKLGRFHEAARSFRQAIDAGIRDSLVLEAHRRALSRAGAEGP
jgi:Tfp pilus assembly protein PilF